MNLMHSNLVTDVSFQSLAIRDLMGTSASTCKTVGVGNQATQQVPCIVPRALSAIREHFFAYANAHTGICGFTVQPKWALKRCIAQSHFAMSQRREDSQNLKNSANKLIMPKFRFSLTIEDYYDYVGTPSRMVHIPLKNRVRCSLPHELSDGYNLKFKIINVGFSFHKHYRVHISKDISLDDIGRMMKTNERFAHKFYDITVKPIKKPNVKVS